MNEWEKFLNIGWGLYWCVVSAMNPTPKCTGSMAGTNGVVAYTNEINGNRAIITLTSRSGTDLKGIQYRLEGKARGYVMDNSTRGTLQQPEPTEPFNVYKLDVPVLHPFESVTFTIRDIGAAPSLKPATNLTTKEIPQ